MRTGNNMESKNRIFEEKVKPAVTGGPLMGKGHRAGSACTVDIRWSPRGGEGVAGPCPGKHPTAAKVRAVQSALLVGVVRHSSSCYGMCWLDCWFHIWLQQQRCHRAFWCFVYSPSSPFLSPSASPPPPICLLCTSWFWLQSGWIWFQLHHFISADVAPQI